jgi:hypothetical protein
MFFLVPGLATAAWGFALFGGVVVAGTVAFLVRRTRQRAD